jgi:hypothetical protein
MNSTNWTQFYSTKHDVAYLIQVMLSRIIPTPAPLYDSKQSEKKSDFYK